MTDLTDLSRRNAWRDDITAPEVRRFADDLMVEAAYWLDEALDEEAGTGAGMQRGGAVADEVAFCLEQAARMEHEAHLARAFADTLA